MTDSEKRALAAFIEEDIYGFLDSARMFLDKAEVKKLFDSLGIATDDLDEMWEPA